MSVLDELFAHSTERATSGEPLVGLLSVSEVLGVSASGAQEWAWASNVERRHGRWLVTRAQADELAADPQGLRALHREVARLRAEVRMHRGIAERRAQAQAERAEKAARRKEELTKLQARNRRTQ